MVNATYHYVAINRGRYMCMEHGSFCDESDNFLDRCILCENEKVKFHWEINRVSRILVTINNLQERSKRSLAVATSLIGAFGALSLFSPNEAFFSAEGLTKKGWFFPVIATCLLLISMTLYVETMRQMKATTGGSLKEKTKVEWENHVSEFLGDLEINHMRAGWMFSLAVIALVITVVVAFFSAG